MTFGRLTAAGVFFLVTSCQGQVKYYNGSGLIRDVLREGSTSGSIVYSDKCEAVSSRTPIPPHVHPARKTGTTIEVLQDMFSGDSRIELSQDLNWIVRMVEKDVPTDILDVRIHHLTFDSAHTPFPDLFHGPNMAMITILSSPEIRSFQDEHHIVPTGSRLEGNMGSDLPALTGELNDITLSGSGRETVTRAGGMGVLILGDSGYTPQDERGGLEQSAGLAGVSGLPARNR